MQIRSFPVSCFNCIVLYLKKVTKLLDLFIMSWYTINTPENRTRLTNTIDTIRRSLLNKLLKYYIDVTCLIPKCHREKSVMFNDKDYTYIKYN